MIVSASRRTDLPALYSDWFIRRVKAGFCVVPNPFNPRQLSTVSLSPEMVDAVVFWSRYPRPLVRRLPEIGPLADRSVFLFTLVDYPRSLEPHTPSLSTRLESFHELAAKIGPKRIAWRYDPIVFSSTTDISVSCPQNQARGVKPHSAAPWSRRQQTGAPFTGTDIHYHLKTFDRLSRQLEGATHRVIVSIMDPYAKIRRRIAALKDAGLAVQPPPGEREVRDMLGQMAEMAARRGMTVQSCAQEQDFSEHGVVPGACIDADWLNKVFGLPVPDAVDSGQRKHCRCAPSRDIGMYDSCTFGCAYCYATASFEKSRRNRKRHDPNAPSQLPLTGDGRESGKTGPAAQLPLL